MFSNLSKHSLRFRISVTFFLLAALLSTLFSWAVTFALDHMENHYIETTLQDNLKLLITERARQPDWPLPRTTTLTAYAGAPGQTASLPEALRNFAPGIHEYEGPEAELQVIVQDVAGVRYVVTYDNTPVDEIEDTLELVLYAGIVIFSLVAAWLGVWTGDRIVSPVTSLARQIRALGDQVDVPKLDVAWSDDEVGELAKAFEHYMRRVKELMVREREFTSNVSHELRTPIMVASSSVELLLTRGDLKADQLAQLTRLRRAIRQMTNLTDAFLILGREPQNAEELLSELPIEPTLREVVEFRREAAELKRLRLALSVEGHPSVFAPKTAVSVVLDNLLGNALTHTREGEVTVKLSDTSVVIVDTGPGIAEDELGKVFDRKFRGRDASPGGAGLGLSIVQALCERYGWRLALESKLGSGTTASLTFST